MCFLQFSQWICQECSDSRWTVRVASATFLIVSPTGSTTWISCGQFSWTFLHSHMLASPWLSLWKPTIFAKDQRPCGICFEEGKGEYQSLYLSSFSLLKKSKREALAHFSLEFCQSGLFLLEHCHLWSQDHRTQIYGKQRGETVLFVTAPIRSNSCSEYNSLNCPPKTNGPLASNFRMLLNSYLYHIGHSTYFTGVLALRVKQETNTWLTTFTNLIFTLLWPIKLPNFPSSTMFILIHFPL